MRLLEGRTFINHLIQVGAIPDAAYRKVVIEAGCDGVVSIYTQCIGTESLLRVEFGEPCLVVATGQ